MNRVEIGGKWRETRVQKMSWGIPEDLYDQVRQLTSTCPYLFYYQILGCSMFEVEKYADIYTSRVLGTKWF